MNTNDLRAAMDELVRDDPEPDYAAEAWRRGRRRRNVRRWTVTVAAAAGVAAIGAATWLTGLLPFANDDQYLDTGEKPFATIHGRNTETAAFTGELTLKNGCIRLGDVPLLLPDDTDWDPERQELTLDDRTARIGEQAGVSGGFTTENTDSMRIPAGCYDDEFTKNRALISVATIESAP